MLKMCLQIQHPPHKITVGFVAEIEKQILKAHLKIQEAPESSSKHPTKEQSLKTDTS